MAHSNISQLESFDDTQEEFHLYLECMENYFDANAIGNECKVSVFLALLVLKTYKLLRNLKQPKLPKDKTFQELRERLLNYYKPAPIVIAEIFHFHRRNQLPNESIAEYIVQLNSLAAMCSFGSFLEETIQDQFVCGIKSEATQTRLLSKRDLQLQDAKEIASAMELAELNSADLRNTNNSRDLRNAATVANVISEPPESSTSVNLVARPSYRTLKCDSRPSSGGARNCYRCGNRHESSTCKYKDATCYRCKKIGHTAPVCRAGKYVKQMGSVKLVEKRMNWTNRLDYIL